MNEFKTKIKSAFTNFTSAVVKGRMVFLIVFIVLTIACACLIPFTKIEYDLTCKMPDVSYTDDAIDILKQEFDDKGMAYVCVVNVTNEDAQDLTKELKALDGIAAVTYME
ncbi:MAG: hypothetical protein J6V69_01370 [Clostridia bacterium]|nr:hypothetical protein [Clostridia bacterium]